VGRTEQEALSLKALEVMSIIIDQKVGGYDTLISAEHNMAIAIRVLIKLLFLELTLTHRHF
jgi:hypothetical protein